MLTLRVMIVEDDPMVAEINLAFIAEVDGYELVGVCHTGSEALQLIREQKPHLLLLDLFLPDMSGAELLKTAREEYPNLDAIMLTAAKEAPLVQDCVRLGVKDYLVKPYFKEQLHQALENYREFYEAAHQACGKLSQEQIDRILLKGIRKNEVDKNRTAGARKALKTSLPKGLSEKTLCRILDILQEADDISAEEVAGLVGVSVVTARRYLTYLLEEKVIDFGLCYGHHGRPLHRYFLPANRNQD